MLFGCCVQSRHAAVVKALGYDFIEIEGGELLAERPQSQFAPTREHLLETGIPVRGFNRFFPAGMMLVGPEVDVPRVKSFLEVSFARAAQLGGKTVGWGSPQSRNIPEGFPRERAVEQALQALHWMADAAETNGLTVLIEPIAQTMTNFILTLAEALDLQRQVNRPSVRVMADSYHMVLNNDPFENLRAAGPDLFHFHVTDIDRRAPGSNPAEFGMYTQAFTVLKSMGYDRSISAEPNWQDLEPEARLALKTMREAWAKAG